MIITVASGLMMAWTWCTWPDPLVDFGRELYVPWQITNGHTLYRDIAYFNGPFSPYVNAAWMQLFGASLSTLVVANVFIFAIVVALLYRLLDAAAGRLAAVVGALVFVALSGFGRLTPIGNYNFICPYSHEITHGIALSLAAVAFLQLPRDIRTKNVGLAGLLLGLAFLTKVEIALACSLAVGVGFALRVATNRASPRLLLALFLVASALAHSLLAFALLYLRLPAKTALQGTTGSLYWTLFSDVASSPFYRAGLGVDNLRANLLQMSTGAILLCIAALIVGAAGFLAPRITSTKHSEPAAVITFIATAGLAIFTVRSPHWFDSVPKALPLVMVILLIVFFRAYCREPRSTDRSRVLALRVALALFALGLLAKMIANTRLYHYGFALAIPAVLLMAATFVSWGPEFAAAHGADGRVVRSAGLAAVAVLVSLYVTAMIPVLRDQQHLVSSGTDSFLADERGAAVQVALRWIDKSVSENATVAVLPEGAMINFLSRRSNPTPHVNLMPPELAMFGEDRILQDFKAHAPDFVVLCHKDTSEYGLPLFGHDYGQKIAAWIRENYVEVGQIGDRPLEHPDRFGLLVLRHR